jgi:hypothetical protein
VKGLRVRLWRTPTTDIISNEIKQESMIPHYWIYRIMVMINSLMLKELRHAKMGIHVYFGLPE